MTTEAGNILEAVEYAATNNAGYRIALTEMIGDSAEDSMEIQRLFHLHKAGNIAALEAACERIAQQKKGS